MIRHILVLFPALALALPLVTQTAAAAPLEQAADPAQWGGQQVYDQTFEPGDKTDESLDLMLEMCTAVQVLAMDRACLQSQRASGEQLVVCDTRGGKIPVYPGQEPIFPDQAQVYPGQEPVYPDQNEGGLIFIDLAQCAALGIHIDMNR